MSPGIAWRDVMAVGVLAGVGFTVALLISELGYPDNAFNLESAKISVLVASVVAAAIAAVILLSRSRHYARMAEIEEADLNHDDIPDVYQQGDAESNPEPR